MRLKFGNKELIVNKVDITKKVLGAVVSTGTGVIVYNVIKDHLPDDMRWHTKVAVATASWAIGNMARESTKKWAENFVDECVDAVNQANEAIKKAKEDFANQAAQA